MEIIEIWFFEGKISIMIFKKEKKIEIEKNEKYVANILIQTFVLSIAFLFKWVYTKKIVTLKLNII